MDRLPLTAEGDERRPNGNIVWLYRHDNGHLIGAVNPHMEADGDEDGIWHFPTFDSLEVDGHTATSEESDEYSDIIHDALRGEDWSR